MLTINNNRLRQAVRIFLAITIGLIVHYFFLPSSFFLIPLSAIFVMLTSPGNAFYQGLKRFIFLLSVVLVLSFLGLPPFAIKPQLYAVSMGALIGVMINVSVFPERPDVLFREAMVPVLKAYADYFHAIIYFIFFNHTRYLEQKKAAVEYALCRLPVWVFDKGFDQSMQKGHRYFFAKVSELGEILFSLHHLAQFSYDKRLLTKLQKPFMRCTKKVEHFFAALSDVLALKKNKRAVADFSEEIKKIEKMFKRTMPLSIELIDMDKEYVYLIEFISALKELHDILLKLAIALR